MAEIKQQRVLVAVVALTGTFCVVEGAVGVVTHRLVLQADALHLAMDVLALLVSLVAMRLSTRPPTATFTFGLHRTEALAAMMNASLVLGGTIYIVREGLEGLSDHAHGGGGNFALTAGVSVAALCVNGLSAWLLHRGIEAGHHHHGHAHHGHAHAHHGHAHDHHDHHDHDHHDHDDQDRGKPEDVEEADHSLNLRGAWLHVLGDALGSFAALSTSIAMHFGAPKVVDPIASFLVAAILIVGAGRVIRDSALVLLEAAPTHLPIDRVRALIAKVDGVDAVVALHLWSLGSGKDAAAVRVRASSLAVGARVEERLRDEEDLSHVWVHVEPPVE